VYNEPASAFVADFVGRINVVPATAEAGGRVRVGPTSFDCAHDAALGSAVKVYLRPEDVLARPIQPGDSNVFDARIEKVEFLGSYCLVRVASPALGEQRLTVYLSLNFLAEHQLEVGGTLPLRLLPERMRLFI
jgi:iron(III) transport system ATP-binding protein